MSSNQIRYGYCLLLNNSSSAPIFWFQLFKFNKGPGIHLVIVLIKMKVLPVKRRELLLTLSSIVEQVRNQSGCLNAVVYQNIEDDNELLIKEEWSTPKDSDAHLASDLFTILKGAEGLMRQPPGIVITMADQST
jgi:quinol monooxygenase YgiN